MLKKIVDTNIFIDRLSNPALYKEIFLSDGLVYLLSVVLMELRAGAHSIESIKSLNDLFGFFKRVDRVIVPTVKDYEQAGEIIAGLQARKGFNINKSSSITNDCLIAASVRNIGGVLYTQNKKDFQAIHDIFDFKVSFVKTGF